MVARNEQNLKPVQHQPNVGKDYDTAYEMAVAGYERRNAAWTTRRAGKTAIEAAELTAGDRKQGAVLDPTEHIIGYIDEKQAEERKQNEGNQHGPVYDRAMEIARRNKSDLMTAEGRVRVEQANEAQAQIEDEAADEKEGGVVEATQEDDKSLSS